jgi:transposase
MLMLPSSVKIYIATVPIDMRKSFDGLAGSTRSILKQDPLSGHLFVFLNKRADLVKVLWWSHGGFSLYAKRLERGRFRFLKPVEADGARVEVSATELAMILDGIDLKATTKRKRWNPPKKAASE